MATTGSRYALSKQGLVKIRWNIEEATRGNSELKGESLAELEMTRLLSEDIYSACLHAMQFEILYKFKGSYSLRLN